MLDHVTEEGWVLLISFPIYPPALPFFLYHGISAEGMGRGGKEGTEEH